MARYSNSQTKASYTTNPVELERSIKKVGDIIAFTEEDTEGYLFHDKDKLYIIHGKIEKIKKSDEQIDIRIFCAQERFDFIVKNDNPDFKKAYLMEKCDIITALMSGDDCLEIKHGPYFGSVCWRLYKTSYAYKSFYLNA